MHYRYIVFYDCKTWNLNLKKKRIREATISDGHNNDGFDYRIIVDSIEKS